MSKSFGMKLKEELMKNKMTQSDLSRITGISVGTISGYCTDSYFPIERNLKRIAKAFHTSPENLVDGVDPIIKRRKTYVIFGINLKNVLDERQMSGKDLSKLINMSSSSVSGYLKGRSMPSEKVLSRILDTLNITRDELMKDCDFINDKSTIDFNNRRRGCGRDLHHYSLVCDDKKLIKPVEPFNIPNIVLEPVNQKTCTKCMYDNVTDCVVNSMFSYSPDTIQKWARRSICRMTDVDSLDYDPDRAVLIQEMLFKFFINKKKPLRPDSRYFIREKDGEMFLKRNKGELDTLHNYSISRKDENGKTHVTRMVMSEAEKAKVEDILNELSIDFVVRDLADILK